MPQPAQQKTDTDRVVAPLRRQLILTGVTSLVIMIIVVGYALSHAPEAPAFANLALPEAYESDTEIRLAVPPDDVLALQTPQLEDAVAIGPPDVVAIVPSAVEAPRLAPAASVSRESRRLPPVLSGPIHWEGVRWSDLPDTLLPVFRGDFRAAPADSIGQSSGDDARQRGMLAQRDKWVMDRSFVRSPDRLPPVVSGPVTLPGGLPADLPDTSPTVESIYPVTNCRPTVSAKTTVGQSGVSRGNSKPSTPAESARPERELHASTVPVVQSPGRRTRGEIPSHRASSVTTQKGIVRYPLDADFGGVVRYQEATPVLSSPPAAPPNYPVDDSGNSRYPLGASG